jgi:hypothetical protein
MRPLSVRAIRVPTLMGHPNRNQRLGTLSPPLEERHRQLIRVVAHAFAQVSQWPLFPHVEAVLDHEHGLSFEDVVADLPQGLVWSPAGYGPQAEIRASVAALAAVGAAHDDVERYIAIVRHAASVEREYLPGPLEQPDLRLSAEDVMRVAATSANDPQALQRLLALIDSEFVLSFVGVRDAEWWLAVDSRIRSYRDVASIEQYLARRPRTPTRQVTNVRVAPPPSVFVVMPFGPDWSRNVHDMISQACEQVATSVEGLSWSRADEIAAPGRITDQIVNAIETADLIVADLTGNNANVMFELGYADRAGKEVVLLNQKIAATPFDIKDWRQIAYNVDDLKTARGELVTFIRGALNRRHSR